MAPAGAGPSALGRHLIIEPGGEVPPPWTEAERLVVDAATLVEPHHALTTLRRAHHARERLVIELAASFERAPQLMTEAAPEELGPTFAFDREELHHLVWSNSVDHRDPARPTWIALDAAIHAGASAADGASGDVVLADGTAVWIDAGPIRHTDPIDGVPVIHAVAIEHGSLRPPGANVSAADLAPDQLAAVTHRGGGARIIAPAGSGKTRVLTERARHLLRHWNLPPSAVSLVAFNKRAQEEMRERTTDLPGLQVRTLNAIALAIVNGTPPFAAQPKSWRTIDEPDVRRIIGDLVSFPRRRNSDPIAPWIEALTVIRLGLVDPAEVEGRYDGDVDGLAEMWPTYRAALERRSSVDFDDQIYRALLVLLRDPAARRTAQQACRIMLVDEFQDLTPAHLLLIRLLSSPGGAVFGVGDDDQTIYGYNGADPAWLIDFAELFPGSGEHPLEVNYRCPAGIVEVVDRLLRHNSRRVAKVIRAASTDAGGWSVDGGVDAVGAARRAVHDAIAGGARPDEVAVLSRVNALLAPVQVALVERGHPDQWRCRSGVRRPHGGANRARLAPAGRRRSWWVVRSRRHPGGAQAALAIVPSPHHRLGGRTDQRRRPAPPRGTTHERAGHRARRRSSPPIVQTLQKAAESGATTSDLVLMLIDEIGLAGSVASLDANRRGMNRSAQGDDLTAVQHLAALHDDAPTFERWLRSQLAVKRAPGGVLLSTVHRVKGQEWPHVVVHLADADQYPHRLADDVEEERRLFHVAITRASRHATIVTGPRPSPFVGRTHHRTVGRPGRAPDRLVAPPRAEGSPPGPLGRTSSDDPAAGLDAEGQRRFEALRELRGELRDGKPAYVVFDNKTLVAIAREAPTSLRELGRISGVGPAKLERYGDPVIELMTRLTST